MPNSSGLGRAPVFIRTSENSHAPNQELSRLGLFVSARLFCAPLLAQWSPKPGVSAAWAFLEGTEPP